MADTIVIANRKGGSGRTTLAVNLAWALSDPRIENPLKILFIDASIRGDASSLILGKENARAVRKKGIGSILVRNIRSGYRPISGDDIIGGFDSPVFMGKKGSTRADLHLIPADEDLMVFEEEAARLEEGLLRIPEHPVPIPIYSLLSHLVEGIDYRYDLILIDPPATTCFLERNTTYMADHFISPFTPDPSTLNGIFEFAEDLYDRNRMLLQKKKSILGIFALFFNERSKKDIRKLKDIPNVIKDFNDIHAGAAHIIGNPPIFPGPGSRRRLETAHNKSSIFAASRSLSAKRFLMSVKKLMSEISNLSD